MAGIAAPNAPPSRTTHTAARRPGWRSAGLASLLALSTACGGAEIPQISTEGMEPAVGTAIRAALAAVEDGTRDPARWGRLGMVLHAHGLPDLAGDAYAEAARLDDGDHRWPHLQGRLVETADPAGALALADEALRRNRYFSPALALRARVLERLGEDDAAGGAWEALQQASPDSFEASLALGRRRLASGDLEGALTALERLVDLLPSSAAGWSFLSQVRRRLGDAEGAASAAARARHGFPHAVSRGYRRSGPAPGRGPGSAGRQPGQEARARRASAAGDHDTAEGIYRRLLAERPGSAGLHYNHGNALARLGRTDEAEAAYRAALSRDSDSSSAMANLANLLARTGRDEEADALYRRSVAADPTHLPTLLGASSLHFQRGNLRQAERFLRDALARDPDHPAALQGLGQLLATAGRLGEAAGTLTRALTAAGQEGAAAGQLAGLHFLLADVERQRGRRAEALRHLARAEALGMAVPPAFRAQLEAGR